MGTKVMVRATRSFDDRHEGDWYWVDPDNARDAALIRMGYYAHQEDLIGALAEAVVERAAPTVPTVVAAAHFLGATGAPRKGGRRGKVAAKPGEHH